MISRKNIHYKSATIEDIKTLYEWRLENDYKYCSNFTNDVLSFDNFVDELYFECSNDLRNNIIIANIPNNKIAIGVAWTYYSEKSSFAFVSVYISKQNRKAKLIFTFLYDYIVFLFTEMKFEILYFNVKVDNKNMKRMANIMEFRNLGLFSSNGEYFNKYKITQNDLCVFKNKINRWILK